MNSIEERVKRIIREQRVQGTNEDIANESLLHDALGVEVLDLEKFVMALQSEFEIEISEDEAADLDTVQEVIDLVIAAGKRKVMSQSVDDKLSRLSQLINDPLIKPRLRNGLYEAVTEELARRKQDGLEAISEGLLTNLDRLVEEHEGMLVKYSVQSPVFSWAQFGESSKVMEALELGFDVNSNDADGMTLLMLVASNGHAELVGKLRVHGADMSKTCKQNNDFDAVMFACVEGHVEVVRLLLDYVGDINKRYSTHSSQGLVGNQTLLSIAANRGRLDICQLLVSRGADMEVVADCGYTPLMWALVNGASQEAAELLLELGANPDPKTKPVSIYKGALSTPLILSASNNLLRVTRRLIDAGVALNAKDFSGWTALKHASHNGSDEIVSALIAAGADLNLPDHEGWTPLISASSRAAWSTIDLLVDAGADVNHQADGGMTALTQVVNRRVMRHNIVLLSRLAGRDLDPVHSAGYEMALVYAKKLLEAGADPNVIYDKDESDNTLIDEVSELGDEELLNLLVDFGAVRSKGTSEDSDYPETGDGLVIAASHGDVDLVAKLLESGVDVNHLDGDGDTALGICVLKLCSEELDLHSARVFLEIIDLLLDYGAQVDVPGCRVAPLPMVVRLGNIALTNSFLRAGANPNAVLTEMMDDEAGKTAVQLAQEYGHDEIVEILLTLKG